MTLTLNDPSPVGVGINLYKLDLADWNSTAVIQHLSSTQNFPNLDVRTAKSYYLKITDPYGNISEGNVQVVANIPQDSLGSSPITGATEASTYTGTFANSVVADGAAVHSLNLTLRDQYGNPVINESLG